MQSVDSNNGKTFWKKSSKSVPGSMRMVYGAMHPPIIHSPKSSPRKDSGNGRKNETSLDSFQDYQASVNDAWDCADDEFSIISDVKISNRVVQSTALSVIHTHRTSNQLVTTAANTVPPNTNEPHPCSTTITTTTSSAVSSVLPPFQQPPLSNDQKPNVNNSLGSVSVCDRGELSREERFLELIRANKTNLHELRKLSWSGVPPALRADVWKLLSGYLPANAERREETLKRKREEYWSFVRQYFDTRSEDLHHDTYRQIHIDIPRMSPLVALFQQRTVQEMFERILYIWAIRHPASGYVQGINDLVTPFFIVFVYGLVPPGNVLDTYDMTLIAEEERAVVEADSFWCMSKLLDGIQDNYTFAQPGIQNKVSQLRELTQRIDATLHHHLESHEIDYLQFSFRWFNNLLMREIPLGCTIRLWDTLHAEPDGFSHFVLYVCAAFLTHFSDMLMRQKDFQSLMLLLQALPTKAWNNNNISIVVAEAYRLNYVFADAPNHLPGSTTKK